MLQTTRVFAGPRVDRVVGLKDLVLEPVAAQGLPDPSRSIAPRKRSAQAFELPAATVFGEEDLAAGCIRLPMAVIDFSVATGMRTMRNRERRIRGRANRGRARR
jgi:hypothetical protein